MFLERRGCDSDRPLILWVWTQTTSGQREDHHTLNQELLGDKLVSPEDSEALRLPGDLSTLPFAFYPSSCEEL